MRALIQRVSSANVTVDGIVTGAIDRGLLVLAAIHRDDAVEDGDWIIRKLLSVRLFEDEAGKMGRSVQDIGGGLLVVSQFTLYGDLSKGTRPDFGASMPGAQAKVFFEDWMKRLRASTQLHVAEGRFAASMQVQLVNDGPVTLMIDSRTKCRVLSPEC
ncbi:MAG TPA: D-aminoacyl-tRNA deacylase [Planctomycetota bacterium]|nr:D-aminoacyl-tRNA deacylase [Planctomycetota bacterium]